MPLGQVHVDKLIIGGGGQQSGPGKQSLVKKSLAENLRILPKHYEFKFTES